MDFASKNLSAWEIYRTGYQNHLSAGGLPENQQYFISLRDAVINELLSKGFCRLLDEWIETLPEQMDVITFSVMKDIYCKCKQGEWRHTSEDAVKSPFIPHIFVRNGERVLWSKCVNRNSCMIRCTDEIKKVLHTVRSTLRKIHAENLSVTEKETPEKILSEARETAQKLIQRAEADAEITLRKAAEKAESIVKAGTDQAIANYHTMQKQEESKAKERSEKLTDAYLIEQQRQHKQLIDRSMAAFSEKFFKRAEHSATIHGEMCEKTSQFHAKWVQTINLFMKYLNDWQTEFYNFLSQQGDDNNRQTADWLTTFQSSSEHFMEQLNALKTEFYDYLHQWQLALYGNEYNALAERFLELYRIVNVDKLIREEILFRSGLHVTESSDTAATMPESGDKSNIAASNTVLNGLERLNRTLNIFLRRFEATLLGFEIYAFYPQPGECFDESKHILDEESADDNRGKKILRCIVPGMARKRNDDYGDDILMQAVVQTEKD